MSQIEYLHINVTTLICYNTMKTPLMPSLFILLFSLMVCCHGDSDLANHLVLFDALPEGIPDHKTTPFDIRTNYTGTVQLVESRDFRLVVNITAPSLGQAYDVDTRFVVRQNGWLLLEVVQGQTSLDFFSPTWLFVVLLVLAILVGIFTGFHAIKWYKIEHSKQDLSEQKSFTSSSHRGTVDRSKLSLHSGNHQVDGLRLDEILRGDEELRQVREMPEEEEAEALEMEQLKKLKFKDESNDMFAETEDSDPQERNLTKSHLHSQAKTIHKELLKKSVGKKGPNPMYRHTQMGKYEGVPTNDTDDTDDDRDNTLPLRSSSEKVWSSGSDLRVKMEGGNKSTSSLGTYGRPYEKESNLRKSENDLKYLTNTSAEQDPKQLVKADVHPGGKPVMVSITPRDNTSSSRPGNIYMPPSELKMGAKLSTFGQRGSPAVTATAPSDTPTIPSNNRPPIPKKPTLSQSPKAHSTPTQPSVSRQDVSRSFQDKPWGSPGLLSMSDIPEDPHEDEQSGISGSQKSASMYGSSEIFEVPETGNTYYNLDSDIDIPPLDSDDNLWSDGGLPSPRLWSPRGMAEKGKTNDDIKLIPGALKSPGPNSGKMVKPRPNSSIILKSDLSKSPKPKDKARRDNFPPPPSYEEISHKSDLAFEFPPPPQFLQQPNKTSQPSSASAVASSDNPNGDYVLIKHEGKDKPGTRSHATQDPNKKVENQDEDLGTANGTASQGGHRTGGSGKKPFLGPTYMNLTILSTLCVLTLATGVMSLLTKEETRVDITIFAPAHFFTNQTRIFFDELKDTEVKGLEDKRVLVYDVSQPSMGKDLWYYFPCNRTCGQGCDESRGKCVCLKGYRLGPDGNCMDVNECMEGKAKCDKAAGCYNRKGSYDCICGEDFYGDGKTCRDCEQGCPKDHYEEQPCSSDRQKICKACTKSCRHGFYLAQSCGANENALCRECLPQCGDGMFESRQCTNLHDRLCVNMTALALCDTSANVMQEERSRVRSDSIRLEKTPSHYVGFSRYKLKRGTDFFVEVTVRFIDPTPHFLPVNLTQPFDLDLVAPARLGSYVVQRYCPSPVPDYYIFRYKKHKSLTYKLWENGSIEACETHMKFGHFLDDDGNDVVGMGSVEHDSKSRDTFVCAQPGSLTNHFIMDEDFFHARTKWVDKSKRCQRHSWACEECTTRCRTDLFSHDPNCAVDTAGKDDGISPRLMTCYNCCVKKNCSNDCKDYHKRRCQPEQCLKGNLLEFSLQPSWDSSQDDKFFCHIQPVEGQRLLEMDYTVRHTSVPTPLFSSSVKLNGNESWKKNGKMVYSDGILNVVLDSGLDKIPNFVEGAINMNNNLFKVGTYKDQGTRFGSTRVEMDYVFLRPSTPTGVPHMPQAQQDCTIHELDSMNLATNMENPYIHFSDMEAIANDSLPFTVHHKRKVPEVKVMLPQDTPLLGRLFTTVTLEPDSFRGNLYNNGSHWVINISAVISQCPGYFRIRIQDPNNATKNLFDTDLVIFCPKTFNLTFGLQTFDEVTMYKDIMIVIHDRHAVYHFRLHYMSQMEDELRRKEQAEEILTSLDETLPYASKQRQARPPRGFADGIPETPDYPIGLPYLIGIAGVIIWLLVLAVIGLCFLPGIPDTPLVRWYHPLFAIIYMVAQFVYSVVASATIFSIVLYLVTRPYVTLITQHGQKGGVTSASSRLVLLQLQRHLEKELARQDNEVDIYQMQCIRDVKKIVDNMDEMHQDLLKSTSDIFERHRLDLLLEEQKVFVRQKLTKELNKFRDDYLKASSSILRRIRQDALASYQNIEHNNTWLEGARFLHKMVHLFQKAHKLKAQNFMEWTGINMDKSSLDIDLSFSLPSLPRLDEIQAPPPVYKPPIKRDLKESVANEMIRSIQVHNNWFFPLADSPLGAVIGYKAHKPDVQLSEREEGQTMLYVFMTLLIVCDLFLLAHRMTKAWTTARLILFGFPEYYRERKEEDGPDDVFESKNTLTPVQSCRDSPWLITVKMFFTQTISTTFLPKMIGAIAACVVLVCILHLSNTYLTVSGLHALGLYHSANQSVSLQIRVTNSRIHAHSAHINSMEYPSFQALTNAHLSTHKTVFGYYREQLFGLQNLTAQMYCLHLKAIGIPSNCSDFGGEGHKVDDLSWLQMEALTHACRFQPVMPQIFQRKLKGDSAASSERQVETLLESLRTIIYYTSHLIVIFLIIIVMKELLFATIWILLQRSGLIRVRIIVEHDQGNVTH